MEFLEFSFAEYIWRVSLIFFVMWHLHRIVEHLELHKFHSQPQNRCDSEGNFTNCTRLKSTEGRLNVECTEILNWPYWWISSSKRFAHLEIVSGSPVHWISTNDFLNDHSKHIASNPWILSGILTHKIPDNNNEWAAHSPAYRKEVSEKTTSGFLWKCHDLSIVNGIFSRMLCHRSYFILHIENTIFD